MHWNSVKRLAVSQNSDTIRRRIASILLTGGGRGHPWVPAKLSAHLYPCSLPPKVLSFVAWNGILWWIFLEPKSNMTVLIRTAHGFTITTVKTQLQFITYPKFFSDLSGGHSPLSPSDYTIVALRACVYLTGAHSCRLNIVLCVQQHGRRVVGHGWVHTRNSRRREHCRLTVLKGSMHFCYCIILEWLVGSVAQR